MMAAALGFDIAGTLGLLVLLKPAPVPALLRATLAVTVATAISSLAMIFSLVFTGTVTGLPVFWLAIAAPIAFALRFGCRPAGTGYSASMTTGSSRWLRWATMGAVVFALAAIALRSFNRPYGGWDALGIWNLKARFIFFGLDDGSWARIFSPELMTSHPDYPLLLPAIVARYWLLLGEPAVLIPATLSIIIFGLTVLMLHAAVVWRSDRLIADLSILVLLAATFFVQHAASQFADNYLALFVLASGVSFRYLQDERVCCTGVGFLFGFLLGLAASVKNEGFLITAVFFALYAVDLLARSDQRLTNRLKRLLTAGAGWLMAIVPTLAMKHGVELSNDLIGSWSVKTLPVFLSPERLSQLLGLSAPLAADFLALPLFVSVAAFLVLYGRRTVSFSRTSLMTLAAPVLIIIGYLSILWITPHEMEWHVTTTVQRLLVHVWPLLIFALASSLKTQDE